MKRVLIAMVLAVIAGTSWSAEVSGIADAAWETVFRFQSKLAEQGNAEAQFKLGEMYEQGLAVERDRDIAKGWYQKAAAQGHEGARGRLDAMTKQPSRSGSPSTIARDEAKAREQAQREAEARQRAAREQAAREQAAREKAAREKAAREKVAREKAAREKAAREKAARERAAREKEKARRDAAAAAAAEKARQEALAQERAEQALEARNRVQAETAVAATAQENGPDRDELEAAEKKSAGDEQGSAFKVDPCDGPAARFMSNCR